MLAAQPKLKAKIEVTHVNESQTWISVHAGRYEFSLAVRGKLTQQEAEQLWKNEPLSFHQSK